MDQHSLIVTVEGKKNKIGGKESKLSELGNRIESESRCPVSIISST